MKQSKAERRQVRNRQRAIKKLRQLKTKFKFVDHPRYGHQPIYSGENFTEGEVRRSFWQYSRFRYVQQIIFPETAIRANVMKQNAGCSPRQLYVDIAKPCRKCRRWFIFFALEQKYWFETLSFFVDADCLECQDCRHFEHEFLNSIDRYGVLLAKEDKSALEWQELSDLGDMLFAAGYIKKSDILQKSRLPKSLRAPS